jgi:hypothetical protein
MIFLLMPINQHALPIATRHTPAIRMNLHAGVAPNALPTKVNNPDHYASTILYSLSDARIGTPTGMENRSFF